VPASGVPAATALTGRVCSQSDHSIRIDDRLVIDGRARAKDTETFSPCHMNHSSRRANVGRHTQRRAGRVSFYTLRDVQVRLWLDKCCRACAHQYLRRNLPRHVFDVCISFVCRQERSCCSIMAGSSGREENT